MQNPMSAAELIWRHWQSGAPLDSLPPACQPTTRNEGYAVQACLPLAAGRAVLGWKIAATSRAGQQHINVSGPLAGRILSGQVLAPGACTPIAGNRMQVAEPEMAFVFAQDVPVRSNPYNTDEVMWPVRTPTP